MKITYTKENGKYKLFLESKNKQEEEIIERFGRDGDIIAAKIEDRRPGYSSIIVLEKEM